jgi:hypothetical protein
MFQQQQQQHLFESLLRRADGACHWLWCDIFFFAGQLAKLTIWGRGLYIHSNFLCHTAKLKNFVAS